MKISCHQMKISLFTCPAIPP